MYLTTIINELFLSNYFYLHCHRRWVALGLNGYIFNGLLWCTMDFLCFSNIGDLLKTITYHDTSVKNIEKIVKKDW